jgi:hypothetical protein
MSIKMLYLTGYFKEYVPKCIDFFIIHGYKMCNFLLNIKKQCYLTTFFFPDLLK